MRPVLPSLLVALAVAVPLHAAETEPDATAPMPEVAPLATPELPAAPTMQLEAIQLEERTVADDADAAQVPARGSFWWLVGVIVIAGVILAVLL